VKQFRDAGKTERTYAEPTFQLLRPASANLVLNMTPLYAPNGSPITGGLVKAGGSTLVVAGNVLGQWAGDGLDVSHDYVPHFDLPGGSFVGGLSGSTTRSSGSFVSVTNSAVLTGSGTLTRLGGGTFILNNADSGAITINTGTVEITGNDADGNHPISLEAGSIVTAADGSTQVLTAGESLVVVGPSTITTPGGAAIKIDDGATARFTGRPTTGDTTTTPIDAGPTPTPTEQV
jgi:hypothetical protein